jgi:hypothetical protein
MPGVPAGLQEAPFVGMSDKIDYLRCGNVKISDQSLKLGVTSKSEAGHTQLIKSFQILVRLKINRVVTYTLQWRVLALEEVQPFEKSCHGRCIHPSSQPSLVGSGSWDRILR